MPDDVVLASIPEFARRTGLSARTIWRLVDNGSIPSLRVGRRRLVPCDDAIAALRQQSEREDKAADTQATESDPLE